MKSLWMIVAAAALTLAACQREGDEVVNPVSEPLFTETNTAPQPMVESGAPIAVALEDNNLGFESDRIPAGPIVLSVSNAGNELHSLAIASLGEQIVNLRLEENLAPNESATMEAILPEGSYRAWCPLHEDREGESVQFQTETSDAPSPAQTQS